MAVLRRVLGQPPVEGLDRRGRPLAGPGEGGAVRVLLVVGHRQERRQHDLDAVGARQLRHRGQVVLDLVDGHRARVAGDVVRPRQDHHHLRLQLDDVGPEAQEHLRRRLAADAAVHVGLAREEAAVVGLRPVVGDRVAEEHDARLARLRRGEGGVRGGVAVEAAEVGGHDVQAGHPLLALEARAALRPRGVLPVGGRGRVLPGERHLRRGRRPAPGRTTRRAAGRGSARRRAGVSWGDSSSRRKNTRAGAHRGAYSGGGGAPPSEGAAGSPDRGGPSRAAARRTRRGACSRC